LEDGKWYKFANNAMARQTKRQRAARVSPIHEEESPRQSPGENTPPEETTN